MQTLTKLERAIRIGWIVLLLVFLSAQLARADVRHLSKHGFFDLELRETSSGQLHCQLANRHKGQGTLTLSVDQYGDVSLWFISHAVEVDSEAIDLRLRMARSRGKPTNWTLNDADAYTSDSGVVVVSFYFDPLKEESTADFLNDFRIHDEIDVLSGSGRPLVNFNLRGSSDGLIALRECSQRTRVSPPRQL